MNWIEALMTIRLDRLVHSPAAAALGRTLLHSLWEGAAIALVLAVVLLVVRSSRVRYAAACMAMIVMLSGMVVTFVRLAPATPVRILLTGSKYATHATPGAFPLVSAPPNETKPIDDLAWLAPFWIAGVLIFQTRGVTSWMAARRLRRTGVCCAPALWQTRLDRLGERLRVARPVVLLESCLAEVPVVIGYLRPVVLMPVGLLAGLPAGQVEAILLHELAHIRRFDYLVNLLQVFVEGLLFYHPGVWWISNVMRAERENCCDDLVVAATGGALEYATALTTLERRRVYRGTALAATDGKLVNRLQRLLGRPERRYVGVMPMLTAAILTVSVVTAMAALQMPASGIVNQGGAPEAARRQTAIVAKPVLSAQAAPVRTPPDTPRQDRSASFAATDSTAVAGLRKDLEYAKWITEDVVYIISDEERKAFKQLTSNPEREHFVEQFWLRRDPTPGTEENEFKEEHYRRIAYVNEHFTDAKGVAGWRTDRGRIYIQYGPPDQIETHSSGGTLQRSIAQLTPPAITETYPYEQWMYRYIDGVGKNIILEFVDSTLSGEFRLTMSPTERDALIGPPPAVR